MRRRLFGPARKTAILPLEIKRAHQLLTAGDFLAAAQAFEDLARRAEEIGGPRAPIFLLQAGKARIFGGNLNAGMQHLKRGLTLLAERGQWMRMYHAGRRSVDELQQRGLTREAGEIESFLRSNLPALADLPTQRVEESAMLRLPTHCPACGGPLRPNEVEWLSPESAECPYCASPVQAQV
ncbi:MAG: hypothetical protein OHK0031_18110 [Anaerolineales bacterium]